MFEQVISGIIQGVTEWLPISSDGMITLVRVNLFKNAVDINLLLRQILFLHFGTFLAALIYLRKDVLYLIKNFLNYRKTEQGIKRQINFYVLSTIISGIIGLTIYKFTEEAGNFWNFTGKAITIITGLSLLVTAVFQIKSKQQGFKKAENLEKKDGFLLGLAQGLSVLPGLSRSGLTVSILLLRKFNDNDALRISFLMSLPVILGGNILMNMNSFIINFQSLAGVFFAFIFGLSTIHFLLKFADKIKFGWFVFVFGIITIASVLI
jgi:undecaprenyl-diphosphatase